MEPPIGDLTFPVFDVVAESLGASAWDGWMLTDGELVGIARVRGGAPDAEGAAGLRPGVTVWSFAPSRLAGVYSGPSHQAVLAFAARYADEQRLPVRDATRRLVELVSSGGDPVTAVVDGEPAPGRAFPIGGIGRLVTSVEPAHAFAAAFYLTPAILTYQSFPAPTP